MNNSNSQIIEEILQDVTEANRLSDQYQHDKAIALYTKSLTNHPKRSLIYCARGKLYNDIKDLDASKADYIVALALANNHEAEDIPVDKTNQACEAIEQIIELQELAILRSKVLTKLETIEDGLQTQCDLKKELDTTLETQEKFESQILVNLNRSSSSASTSPSASNIHIFDLKFDKPESLLNPIDRTEFEAYKKESKELLKQMMERIKNLEEANQYKLNNYSEMLDEILIKSLMSESEQEKIKNYHDTFLSTFSSVFIASQAIDNGTISFQTEVEKLDLVTLAISFIPVAGDGIASALEIIANFVNDLVVIRRARVMASMAPDTVQLNQIVGGAVYSILTDKEKQKQILNPVKDELDQTENIFEKLAKFIKKESEEIDAKLYGEKYETFEKKLGYLDARFLITTYLSAEIRKPSLSEKFATEVLKNRKIKEINILQKDNEKDGKDRKKKSKCFCF